MRGLLSKIRLLVLIGLSLVLSGCILPGGNGEPYGHGNGNDRFEIPFVFAHPSPTPIECEINGTRQVFEYDSIIYVFSSLAVEEGNACAPTSKRIALSDLEIAEDKKTLEYENKTYFRYDEY